MEGTTRTGGGWPWAQPNCYSIYSYKTILIERKQAFSSFLRSLIDCGDHEAPTGSEEQSGATIACPVLGNRREAWCRGKRKKALIPFALHPTASDQKPQADTIPVPLQGKRIRHVGKRTRDRRFAKHGATAVGRGRASRTRPIGPLYKPSGLARSPKS